MSSSYLFFNWVKLYSWGYNGATRIHELEDIVGSHANVEDRFRHLDMVRIMHNALGFRMSERSPSTSDGIFSEQR